MDGLITVDPEGFITDVNEQMCRMTELLMLQAAICVENERLANEVAASAGISTTPAAP